mmetsp:Transcript_90796/g.194723  ORF Transcript_90796/g.194723 Transcript_90796/m.194723 type:complete len:270 (-) Transcript_90796:308-1117(-)
MLVTQAGSAFNLFPETRRVRSARMRPSSSGSSSSRLPMSFRFRTLCHFAVEPVGISFEIMLPCTSRRSMFPASEGKAFRRLAGMVTRLKECDVKGGSASMILESRQSSCSTGSSPTSSGSVRRKLPLQKSCSSEWSWPTSAGSDSRPFEMSTRDFKLRHSPISGGRPRSPIHEEMRTSVKPSKRMVLSEGTGGSRGGHPSELFTSLTSSRAMRRLGARPMSEGLSSRSWRRSRAKVSSTANTDESCTSLALLQSPPAPPCPRRPAMHSR